MSVVKGSEDENREGVGMDGSRVVKIFELDAAQGFVGLGWLCKCSALSQRRRRQEKEDGKKKGATSAHGKRPSGSATAETSKRQQQQEAAGAAAVATGAGTVRE